MLAHLKRKGHNDKSNCSGRCRITCGASTCVACMWCGGEKMCSFEIDGQQANIRIVLKNLAKSNEATTERNPPNTSFHDVHSWWYGILYFCAKKNLLLDNLLIFPFLWFAIVMEWGKIQEPSYTKECNKFIKTTEFCHLQYLQGLSKDLKNQVS